ncbi:hypothetical protein [Salsipaludibacter albus]|uniref:hypothetical protein n=1 Tax=Salsipaludibacter albus TaxID=2849650 RepID=UPI001EE3F23F|nr:hypothetical protein [Salsipaludibacter albus]MBY5162146.1 hypothetical protein [Salsipaludibacter albus]
MINDLKATLKQQVDGLSDEQAMQAAQAATGFIKDRLPEPIGSRLEELVDGDGTGDLDVNQLKNTVSGFLGK